MDLTLILIFQMTIVVLISIAIAIPITFIYVTLLIKLVDFVEYLERKKYGNKTGIDLELEKTRKKLNRKHSRF